MHLFFFSRRETFVKLIYVQVRDRLEAQNDLILAHTLSNTNQEMFLEIQMKINLGLWVIRYIQGFKLNVDIKKYFIIRQKRKLHLVLKYINGPHIAFHSLHVNLPLSQD